MRIFLLAKTAIIICIAFFAIN